MTEYVLGFCFDGDKLLLIEKAKPIWQKFKLNAIGGKIEEGEDGVTAMVREFKEETGLDTVKDDWKDRAYIQGPDYSVFIFVTHKSIPSDFYFMSNEEPVKLYDVSSLRDLVLIDNLMFLIPLMKQDCGCYYTLTYETQHGVAKIEANIL